MSDAPFLKARVLVPFVVATLIWGTTWIVIRDQLGVVPPSWSVAYRFLVGATVMFAWGALRGEPLRLERGAWGFVAAFGVAQFVMNFNFVYRAEHYITSGLVAVVFALLLVPNALFGRIFLKQPVQGRFLLGSIVAITGVAMLILHEARADPSSGGATLTGAALTIAGVLSASVANIMQGTPKARALPMTAMLAWGMLIGAIVDAGFATVTVGAPVFDWRWGYVAGILHLGVLASAVAFTAYFAVIRAVGPARAAYSGVLVPIIAMVISTLVEDYRWSLLSAAGGAVALAGLLIALSAKRPAVKSG
jgi:drug/metabolite transporter (DMT)-like permease